MYLGNTSLLETFILAHSVCPLFISFNFRYISVTMATSMQAYCVQNVLHIFASIYHHFLFTCAIFEICYKVIIVFHAWVVVFVHVQINSWLGWWEIIIFCKNILPFAHIMLCILYLNTAITGILASVTEPNPHNQANLTQLV